MATAGVYEYLDGLRLDRERALDRARDAARPRDLRSHTYPRHRCMFGAMHGLRRGRRS